MSFNTRSDRSEWRRSQWRRVLTATWWLSTYRGRVAAKCLVTLSDIRAWVTLANWKSMSDVTNMCQFTFEVYRSHGDQERQENRNRKIKFVFH